MARVNAEGGHAECVVYPEVYHAFEIIEPDTELAQQINALRKAKLIAGLRSTPLR